MCREQRSKAQRSRKGAAEKEQRPLCATEKPDLRMWLGSAGLVASMHYDTGHNTHTVLYGAKQFIVAPPSDWDKVYLHPSIHPSNRQSMLPNVTHPRDTTNFPRVKQMTLLETILRPGETLYVPPFWLHSVRSLTTTLAVNFWTQSAAGRLSTAVCTTASALSLCPQIFDPLWDALAELGQQGLLNPDKKSEIVGGCMFWYQRPR